MMSTRLNDMLELFVHADTATRYLRRVNDASTQDRVRALAEIVKLNPSVLHKQEELQRLCNNLGAEQIAIADEDGIIEAAVPASLVGLNLEDGESVRPAFSYDAGGNEVITFVGVPDQQGIQYAREPRVDRPGAVRVGFRRRWEQESRIDRSISNSKMRLRLGEHGRVVVFRRGVRMNQGGPAFTQADLLALPAGQVQERSVDDENYFLYAVDEEGYRLVGVLPASEIYKSSLRAVYVVLASNLILFLLMFAVVSWLLQKVVLRGISRVNDTLMKITEGDLEKRVDVHDNVDFARLSNGINFMVDSLRSMGEERQQSMKRNLEFARTIQNTALRNRFPAFPYIKEFDLCATCLQANEVGGDFYDFSMPDERHLHFLVADVDASGIPAALFMMRAMTILRGFARAGEYPKTVVTAANRELCEGNQAGIRMGLFYGSLDIATGELTYVCAGKAGALLQRAGGGYEPFVAHEDQVLGERATASFCTSVMTLEPHDRIILYTEGVLNASNMMNAPFSEKRLRRVLDGEAPTAADVLQLVRSSLRQYVGDVKLKKDVTMLCLEYCGMPSNFKQLQIRAGQSDQVRLAVSEQLEELFAAPSDIEDVQRSVHAVLAKLPPELPVRVDLDFTEKQAIVALHYPAPKLNLLEGLGELPMSRATHEFATDNLLTLWKDLI